MSYFAWSCVGAPEFEGNAERWGRNSQRHCGIDESSEGGNEELSLCPRTHWAGREGRRSASPPQSGVRYRLRQTTVSRSGVVYSGLAVSLCSACTSESGVLRHVRVTMESLPYPSRLVDDDKCVRHIGVDCLGDIGQLSL